MKKRLHFIFIAAIAVIALVYIQHNDFLKSYTFGIFQKGMPSGISNEKVIFVDDTFSINDYNSLLDKLKNSENSVALLLPQIFNMKIGGYLENINIKEIEQLKKDYRVFTFKLAEMKNVIPVAFVSKNKNEGKSVDLGAYQYFKKTKIKMNLRNFNYVKINSRRMWLTSRYVGFFEDYSYYPYKVPVVFKFDKYTMANAAVEGIKQYYKFSGNRIKVDNKNLLMGEVVKFPLLSNGEMILPRVNTKPKIYTLKEFLNMSPKKLEDKMVIVKSSNNSMATMLSLGVTVSSIMDGKYIKYNRLINYLFAVILFVGLVGLFTRVKLGVGVVLFGGIQILLVVSSYMFMRNNVHTDFVMFTFINIVAFFSVYFYSVSNKIMDYRGRVRTVRKFMHEDIVHNFVRTNRDIQTMNMWLDTYAIYILFDEEFAAETSQAKITFELLKELIYNNKNEFYMKFQGNYEISVVLLKENPDLLDIMNMLFKIRETLGDMKYNILLNSTKVYVYNFDGELVFVDKEYKLKTDVERLERKQNIIVHEKDIQKYINLIKFQKIAGSDNDHLFNIVGIRKET